MTVPTQEAFRAEAEEFLNTCSLTEKLRAHDPLLADRLETIERERASILLALTAHPVGAAQAQLTERIRALRPALARLEREASCDDDPGDTPAQPERAADAEGAPPASPPCAVPIERLASDARAALPGRATWPPTALSSLPSWKLATLVLVTTGLAAGGALYLLGKLPALLVAAVLVTTGVALELLRRRDPSSIGAAERRGLEVLLTRLGHAKGRTRQRARLKLVELGGPKVVAALVQGLTAESKRVRWECAKALWALPAADTAEAQVGVLLADQEDHGIQWIAGETLILQRSRGLRALLRALEAHADAPTLIYGARHVLRELREDGELGEIAAPVFAALNGPDPALHVPSAAFNALSALDDPGMTPPRGSTPAPGPRPASLE